MKWFHKMITPVIVIIYLVLSVFPVVYATDIPLLTIESYDEYRSFLKETKLPEDFVTYSDLSHFGEFDVFVRLCSPLDDYSSYMYGFIDACDYKSVISVDRVYETPAYIGKYPLLDAGQLNLSDMRTLPSGENGRYVIGNITYWYISGKLSSIRWHQDGMYFQLSVSDPRFAEYPLDTNTTIAKLLNIQNKSADELTVILQGNQISPWLYIAAGAVLIISASAAIYLWKRRKKQCSPPEQQ